MPIELYNTPISTSSQKVRMALLEKGVAWTERAILFERGDHLSDWYLRLNPDGVVPTLLHDGHVITDDPVINEYVDEVFPDKPLRPRAPVPLAHMRMWRAYIDNVATEAICYPSFNAHFASIAASMSDRDFEAYAAGLLLRQHFYRRMGPTGFHRADVDAALDRLRETVERMDRSLASTEWLANDMFTLADISAMPAIVRMEDLGLAHIWADLPRVADWYTRIQKRPAFAKTYPAEARMLGAAFESGRSGLERDHECLVVVGNRGTARLKS